MAGNGGAQPPEYERFFVDGKAKREAESILKEAGALRLAVQHKKKIAAMLASAAKPREYSDCWAYLVQAIPYNPYVVFLDRGFIALSYRSSRISRTPEFFVAKIGGLVGSEDIREFCGGLVKASGNKVILKNLSSSQYYTLKSRGFKDYSVGDGWSPGYRYDDDTYPQVVYDCVSSVSMKGGAFRNLKWFYRRLRPKMQVVEYSRALQDDALRVLKGWKKIVVERLANRAISDEFLFYSVDIHGLFIEDRMATLGDGFAFLVYLNGRPVGFNYSSFTADENCVSSFTNITSDGTKGLSELLMKEQLTIALERGKKFLNIGGSEFKSLHEYKMKFRPKTLIRKYHVVDYLKAPTP